MLPWVTENVVASHILARRLLFAQPCIRSSI